MKFNRIRNVTLATAVFLSPLVLFAQDPMSPSTQTGKPNQPQHTTPGMQDSATNANEVSQAMKDKMFLRHAAEGGMAEVKLGQLAAQKGGSEEVKAFGQKMVDDHTTLNNEMAAVADSIGVRLPKTITKEDQAEYDKLSGLSGSAFDTEYLTVMVKNHHADLHTFRIEIDNAGQPALEDAVVKATKVIREHTMMVDKLAHDRGIPVPTRPANKSAPSPATQPPPADTQK
jgi:putative membrane protein